jgi:DNA-binding transcriptional regulator YiaG
MDVDALPELARIRALVRTGAARPIRLHAGLSLREVTRSVGVSPGTILRWENGERVPHGDAALTYGRLLHALTDQQRSPRRRSA